MVILNDAKILDIDVDEVAPEGKTVDGNNHPGLSRKSGHIALLGHNSVVEFRNLRVVDLSEKNKEDSP